MGKPGKGIFLGLESARLASMCLDVMTSAEVFGEWEPLPEVNVWKSGWIVVSMIECPLNAGALSGVVMPLIGYGTTGVG
jgi:hypothetical protein